MDNSSNLFSLDNQAWLILGQVDITVNFVLLFLAIFLAIWKRKAFWSWIVKGNKRPNDRNKAIDSALLDSADECKALILICSRLDQMEWLVQQVNPQSVHVLANTAEGFKAPAIELQDMLQKKGIPTQISFVNDINSVSETFKAVKQAALNYRSEQIDNIIIDVTGGAKPMSIGSYLAAKELQEIVSYVSVDFSAPGKPIHNTTKVVALEFPETL